MRRPDFFIVGASRCGTTAMSHYLQQHPEVFMALSEKEPHFFGTDLYFANHVRDEQSYLSLFDEARDEKRAGEKSVSYLYSKLAPSEIKAFKPEARIIIMLRNPVDMIHSIHSLLVYIGHENITDFSAALDAEDERRRGLRLPEGASPDEAWQFLYRDKAEFTEQVKRCLDTFGREKVHIVVFEDFIRDTAGAYRDTLSFLDVSLDFQPEFRRFNTNRSVRSLAMHKFIKRPPPSVRSLVKAVTPSRMRERVAAGLLRLNTNKGSRPPLPESLRRKLRAEFFPEIQRLSILLGRDLTHWCREDSS